MGKRVPEDLERVRKYRRERPLCEGDPVRVVKARWPYPPLGLNLSR